MPQNPTLSLREIPFFAASPAPDGRAGFAAAAAASPPSPDGKGGVSAASASNDSRAKFRGSCVALLTPFTKKGELDEAALRKLVAWHIAQGSHGLLAVGTTGESPTLSHAEHKQVVEWCVDAARGSGVWVLAGTGSNATREAIDLTQHAVAAGADGVLVVTPYYNKPTQAGLVAHYEAVADVATEAAPLFIYDIPGRSVVKVEDATLAVLAKHRHIGGIKDSSQDLARPTVLANLLGGGFAQFSGEDGTALPHRAAGGDGCISVTANVAPRLLAEMHDAWDGGDVGRAMAINSQLMPLHAALFAETSPGPVKYAAELLGLCGATTRLPLVEIGDASKKQVRAAMAAAGLLAE